MLVHMSKETQKYYQSKYERLKGSNDKEVFYEARQEFNKYQKKRRQPYIRSKYFDGQKVFLSMFWTHLNQKSPVERQRRIVFIRAAFDLIRNSHIDPVIEPQEKPSDIYYRFYGKTKSGENFAVQVMKDKKSNRYFMSCFPTKKKFWNKKEKARYSGARGRPASHFFSADKPKVCLLAI